MEIRAIALPTLTAQQVRATMSSPGYGHPAFTAVANGHGPCRHCLRPFRVGEERRTLFTYNPFDGLAEIPLPGPVFIHTEPCERFDRENGYPEALMPYPVVLDAYDQCQHVVAQRRVPDGDQERAIQEIFCDESVRYVMVRDRKAGCFDFRVERRSLLNG